MLVKNVARKNKFLSSLSKSFFQNKVYHHITLNIESFHIDLSYRVFLYNMYGRDGLIYQLKYSLLQDLAEPHHFVSTNGGHRRPPLRACLTTSLRRCISPIPQDLLHSLQGDQDDTRQSRGGPANNYNHSIECTFCGYIMMHLEMINWAFMRW